MLPALALAVHLGLALKAVPRGSCDGLSGAGPHSLAGPEISGCDVENPGNTQNAYLNVQSSSTITVKDCVFRNFYKQVLALGAPGAIVVSNVEFAGLTGSQLYAIKAVPSTEICLIDVSFSNFDHAGALAVDQGSDTMMTLFAVTFDTIVTEDYLGLIQCLCAYFYADDIKVFDSKGNYIVTFANQYNTVPIFLQGHIERFTIAGTGSLFMQTSTYAAVEGAVFIDTEIATSSDLTFYYEDTQFTATSTFTKSCIRSSGLVSVIGCTFTGFSRGIDAWGSNKNYLICGTTFTACQTCIYTSGQFLNIAHCIFEGYTVAGLVSGTGGNEVRVTKCAFLVAGVPAIQLCGETLLDATCFNTGRVITGLSEGSAGALVLGPGNCFYKTAQNDAIDTGRVGVTLHATTTDGGGFSCQTECAAAHASQGASCVGYNVAPRPTARPARSGFVSHPGGAKPTQSPAATRAQTLVPSLSMSPTASLTPSQSPCPVVLVQIPTVTLVWYWDNVKWTNVVTESPTIVVTYAEVCPTTPPPSPVATPATTPTQTPRATATVSKPFAASALKRSGPFDRTTVIRPSNSFAPTRTFTPSPLFGASALWAASPGVSPSHAPADSQKLAPTPVFTPSPPFAPTGGLGLSAAAAPTGAFTGSATFTPSPPFELTDPFPVSASFVSVNPFALSSAFSPTETFTPTKPFLASEPFTPTALIGGTQALPLSSDLAPTPSFGPSATFLPVCTLPPTSPFTATPPFSDSAEIDLSRAVEVSGYFADTFGFGRSSAAKPSEPFTPSDALVPSAEAAASDARRPTSPFSASAVAAATAGGSVSSAFDSASVFPSAGVFDRTPLFGASGAVHPTLAPGGSAVSAPTGPFGGSRGLNLSPALSHSGAAADTGVFDGTPLFGASGAADRTLAPGGSAVSAPTGPFGGSRGVNLSPALSYSGAAADTGVFLPSTAFVGTGKQFESTRSAGGSDYFAETFGFGTSASAKKSELFTPSNSPILTPAVYKSAPPRATSQWASSHGLAATAAFSASSAFAISALFDGTPIFRPSEALRETLALTASPLFAATGLFTPSADFAATVPFSASAAFADSDTFLRSITFAATRGFSASSAFAASLAFAHSLPFPASASFAASLTFPASGSLAQSSSLLLILPAPAPNEQAGFFGSAGAAVGAGLAGLAALAVLLLLFLLKKKKPPEEIAEMEETTVETTLDDGVEFISEYGLSEAGGLSEVDEDGAPDMPGSGGATFTSDQEGASEHNPDEIDFDSAPDEFA